MISRRLVFGRATADPRRFFRGRLDGDTIVIHGHTTPFARIVSITTNYSPGAWTTHYNDMYSPLGS